MNWRLDNPPKADLQRVRDRYRTFAEREAAGVSPLYEEFARRVASSNALSSFVATLPMPKQQPNLLFAAVRFLFGVAPDAEEFERLVGAHGEAIRVEMLVRSTQTNEPARCATILPVLTRLPQPLALAEVGASAGLCLLPDRYGYDYGRARLLPADTPGADPPVFPCVVNDSTPVPTRLPRVVWRRGLDLNPLDVRNSDDVRWLESLVWPGQSGRLERLSAAIRVARDLQPLVTEGDLLSGLESVFADAPAGATRVLFHSAVLAYLAPAARQQFAHRVREMEVVWISNEAPGVLPEIDALAGADIPRHRFILAVDGTPVAFTGPHGQSIDWIGSATATGSERA